MGPLIPVILAIAAWGCSSRYGVDENPILTDSGNGGKDLGLDPGPDATSYPDSQDSFSYADAPHVDLPNADGYSPDIINADLFAEDASEVSKDVSGDTAVEIQSTPKFCEPKITLPTTCDITEVAAGGNVSCLIKSGTVYCAGKINSSANPNTSLCNSTSFIEVPSLAGAEHIAVGGAHICAIMPGNDVKCMGQNIWGQLGDGTTQDAKDAVPVINLGDVAKLSLGSFHSLAVDTTGQIYTWGLNSGGQLGIAAAPLKSTTPQAIALPANTGAISSATGSLHSASVLSDGIAYAWGNNALFPMGVGATGKVLTPKVMQNSTLGLCIAAGDDFTLFLDQKCAVSSVGNGGLGQLGLGSTSEATTLTLIPSLSGVTAIIAGGQHACAVTQEGTLFCWGENNFGTPTTTPSQVAGISSVVQTSLGTNHGIALTAGCQVYTWGKNNVGQLGMGSTTDAPSPTAITIN